ncbi:multidrug ABC transporter ATP-binding protein [Candidatus Uabimicrobium amorphum]|uniref:Multidrug ABC transporter ATP-binding protein n=2 Tax=Uabimicrobium amorphum TaxID=2596890 RepID=A0A5S9F2S4_UABAM|nr:multidrug ABC transporter ATP-binding protein [Candidatus Uabimicrobium amorphum]
MRDIPKILNLAKPETKTLLLGTFFLFIGSGLTLIYPQVIRVIVDEALKSKNAQYIDAAALFILIVFVIASLFSSCRYYLFTTAGERIVKRLRQDLYRAVILQDIAFFDSSRTGELMSRLSSDTTILQNTVSVNISQMLRGIVASLGGIAFLVYTSPILSLTVIALIPPIAVSISIFGRKIRDLSKQSQDALAQAAVVAEETISGIRTVRAFAQEKNEVQRYQKSLDGYFSFTQRRIYQIALFSNLASLIGYIGVTVVIWYGGRQVVSGNMSIGDLTSFLLYMITVTFAVASLASLWTDFMNASGAAARVFELIDRQPQVITHDPKKLESWCARVKFQDVGFVYPSRPDIQVLCDVNFEMEPGEMVALVGPSGGGKSTIAHLIQRFYDPIQGTIYVSDCDIRHLDGDYLRKNIGVVAQDPILLSTTIAENVCYGKSDSSEQEILDAIQAANAREFVDKFPEGIHTIVGEKGIQLSGGQKQRIAIARAILKDPSLLILDEATSALDTESEHLVQEALERLMQNRTTLVIAHRLSTVRHADRVIVIDSGKIVQQGKHEELMEQHGLYSRLVARQFVK